MLSIRFVVTACVVVCGEFVSKELLGCLISERNDSPSMKSRPEGRGDIEHMRRYNAPKTVGPRKIHKDDHEDVCQGRDGIYMRKKNYGSHQKISDLFLL